ncbi:hypothetical protein GCM10017668_06470 [Streptomyces tuirus]|uniref:Uncharacterized protein n=2 Tax=Streptomyces tuirus TaxID=68278 RepID=A0A7G1NB65_9ACTN|nr:hypothetical protein GCM10017668_06470 [Streptomyces tuirus]
MLRDSARRAPGPASRPRRRRLEGLQEFRPTEDGLNGPSRRAAGAVAAHPGAMASVKPVVVYPPSADGGRRVRVDDQFLGIAYGPLDIAEFLRRAGIEDADEAYVAATGLIEWRGGGPGAWTADPDGDSA